jgi:hypothetical protein
MKRVHEPTMPTRFGELPQRELRCELCFQLMAGHAEYSEHLNRLHEDFVLRLFVRGVVEAAGRIDSDSAPTESVCTQNLP